MGEQGVIVAADGELRRVGKYRGLYSCGGRVARPSCGEGASNASYIVAAGE